MRPPRSDCGQTGRGGCPTPAGWRLALAGGWWSRVLMLAVPAGQVPTEEHTSPVTQVGGCPCLAPKPRTPLAADLSPPRPSVPHFRTLASALMVSTRPPPPHKSQPLVPPRPCVSSPLAHWLGAFVSGPQRPRRLTPGPTGRAAQSSCRTAGRGSAHGATRWRGHSRAGGGAGNRALRSFPGCFARTTCLALSSGGPPATFFQKISCCHIKPSLSSSPCGPGPATFPGATRVGHKEASAHFRAA